MYNTSNSIDVLSFDEVKFDVKSDLFERIKKTSNKIRSNVFSVIDVFYARNTHCRRHFGNDTKLVCFDSEEGGPGGLPPVRA